MSDQPALVERHLAQPETIEFINIIGPRAVGKTAIIGRTEDIDHSVQPVSPQASLFEPRALLHETTLGAFTEQREIGIGSTAVAIVMPGSSWHQLLIQSHGYSNTTERRAIIDEARAEIERLLDEDDLLWVPNKYGDLDSAAREVLSIADGVYTESIAGRTIAEDMLRTVRTLG